jgi:hypothetical protein
MRQTCAGYAAFWRKRSTATVVPVASASQARFRAQHKQKRANAQHTGLIRKGTWVRRRQFGSAR